MRPRIIVLGGPQPYLPDALPLDDSFDKDGAAVLRMPDEALKYLANVIAEHPGFLSRQELNKLLSARWDDVDGAKRVARYTIGLDGILRRTGATIARFFASFEAGLQQREKFAPEQKRLLLERSRLMVLEDSAIARQWKAEALATETGRPLQDLRLLCDLRPVFDETRTVVKGMMPLITLKMQATDVNGLPTSFEVQMTTGDLGDLADEVARAETKLETLHTMLSATGMYVPQLDDDDEDEDDDDDDDEEEQR